MLLAVKVASIIWQFGSHLRTGERYGILKGTNRIKYTHDNEWISSLEITGWMTMVLAIVLGYDQVVDEALISAPR